MSATSELSAPADATSPQPDRRAGALDLAVRAVGAVVAVWGGVVLAFAGAFLSPFRVGTVLVPVAVVLAVAGNALLIWFGYRATSSKLLALLPGLVWVSLSFVGSSRTTEGDLVLYQSNWVATVYLLAGSATIGVAAYRMIIPRRRP